MNTLPDDNPDLAAVVPQDILESLRDYALHHVPTRSFLAAVLANDLFDALARADEVNATLLPEICRYVFNCLPQACWGSRERVREWTRVGVPGNQV